MQLSLTIRIMLCNTLKLGDICDLITQVHISGPHFETIGPNLKYELFIYFFQLEDHGNKIFVGPVHGPGIS